MWRSILNILTLLSLFLALAVGFMWVRSYEHKDRGKFISDTPSDDGQRFKASLGFMNQRFFLLWGSAFTDPDTEGGWSFFSGHPFDGGYEPWDDDLDLKNGHHVGIDVFCLTYSHYVGSDDHHTIYSAIWHHYRVMLIPCWLLLVIFLLLPTIRTVRHFRRRKHNKLEVKASVQSPAGS